VIRSWLRINDGVSVAWTEITRLKYRRDGLHYASDATDGEWAVIVPNLPAEARRGRPRTTSLRAVVNAILYIVQTCCQWRLLPKEFPPFTTVQYYFYRWRDDGTWLRINHELGMLAREREGREASPSAGVIDSQSVKTTEAGGPRGYDAGKKIKGRKRHLLTDTLGHLVAALVHPADVQDRDGAPKLLAAIRGAFPWLRHVFADAAYAGGKLEQSSPNSASGPPRSSGAPMRSEASSCCHDDGSSSERLHGSTATVAWPRTSRRPSKAPTLGS